MRSSILKLMSLLFVLPVALLACNSQNRDGELGSLLPLDQEKPTLVMFYTDN